MKKLAYIELDTHAELANNFFELTKDSSQFLVDFYFSEKIFKLLKLDSKNVYLTDYSLLLEILKKQQYDLVIIGTVHRHFIFYQKITELYNTAIVVHNYNFTISKKRQLVASIYKQDYAYRIKLFLKEGLLEAPKVYKKAKYLLGIDELNSKQNKLTFLPIYFNQFDVKRIEKTTINIVIPGAVSQSRRDYFGFLEKLKLFKKTNQTYEIVFLGKASGEELNQLKLFFYNCTQNIKIQYFENKLDQNLFDEYMQKADVLYCPIQTETQFFSIKEIYGKTKISGNIGDAIKYGKPAIFPDTYTTDWDFIIKEKDNLQDQFSAVAEQSFDFSKYSKPNITEKLERVLDSLIAK